MGSSPIGSTIKSCDLQVKREVLVSAVGSPRDLVLQRHCNARLRARDRCLADARAGGEGLHGPSSVLGVLPRVGGVA